MKRFLAIIALCVVTCGTFVQCTKEESTVVVEKSIVVVRVVNSHGRVVPHAAVRLILYEKRDWGKNVDETVYTNEEGVCRFEMSVLESEFKLYINKDVYFRNEEGYIERAEFKAEEGKFSLQCGEYKEIEAKLSPYLTRKYH